MKQAVKRTVARLNPLESALGCRVLLYHAVGRPPSADPMGLAVSEEAFGAQMEWLRSEGYRVIPLTRLLEASGPALGRTVAITFDDGYRSQLRAADILQRFGYPATFFTVLRFLDGGHAGPHYWEQWEHFGWDEAAGLAGRGFEIGARAPAPLRRGAQRDGRAGGR